MRLLWVDGGVTCRVMKGVMNETTLMIGCCIAGYLTQYGIKVNCGQTQNFKSNLHITYQLADKLISKRNRTALAITKVYIVLVDNYLTLYLSNFRHFLKKLNKFLRGEVNVKDLYRLLLTVSQQSILLHKNVSRWHQDSKWQRIMSDTMYHQNIKHNVSLNEMK